MVNSGNSDINEDQHKLTSLDIVAYAFLKEELINTPDSKEVEYLKTNFKNLVNFVEYMDQLLDHY